MITKMNRLCFLFFLSFFFFAVGCSRVRCACFVVVQVVVAAFSLEDEMKKKTTTVNQIMKHALFFYLKQNSEMERSSNKRQFIVVLNWSTFYPFHY